MNNCSICKQPIAPGDDCGGDCTSCMAEAGDLECIVTMYERLKRQHLAASQPAAQGTVVVVAHRYIQRHQSAEHSMWLNGDAGETYVEAERQGLGRVQRAYDKPPEQPVKQAPKGWKLVPVKITDEMENAARNQGNYELNDCGDSVFVDGSRDEQWAAMLSAAPPAPPAKGIDLGKVRQLIGDLRTLGVKESNKNDNAGFVDLRCYWALLGVAGEVERSMGDQRDAALGKPNNKEQAE